jgi:hypothetical protein
MGKELVPAMPVIEGEAYEFIYEGRMEGIYDAYVDVLPVDEDDIETSLDADEEAALESGIASIFDELRAEEPTFVLLNELNRLWAEPLAA